MLVTFHLNYMIHFGEALFLYGSGEKLGGWNQEKAIAMTRCGLWDWQVTIELGNRPIRIEYAFLVKRTDGTKREEWGKRHAVQLTPNHPQISIYDRWQDLPAGYPFYSSAFTDVIFKRSKEIPPAASLADGNLTIYVWAPYVRPDESVVICGETDELGSWTPADGVVMHPDSFPHWTATLSLKESHRGIRYKFAVIKTHTKEVCYWEEGDDRTIDPPLQTEHGKCILTGLQLRKSSFNWRGTGVSIPVFSLRTKCSWGIGEFSDLPRMVDWAKECGMKIIQILPVNDTTMTHTWRDSYPYNANSIYALHPLYLNPPQAGVLHNSVKMKAYMKKAKELNDKETVDYESVAKLKWSYLRDLFEQNGEETLATADFQHFYKKEKKWLEPYALFSFLRDKNKTPDFRRWKHHSTFNQEMVDCYCAPDSATYRQIAIHFFVQYHLHKQLIAASRYARKAGVIFKGDIPIGISRNSVDAWVEPDLFHFDSQAGAPPDDFSVTGQNWGFPTCNWEAMQLDDLSWWRKRFTKMTDYFDAYRIDHILGFFRIWEIPLDSVQGLLGHFNPALPLTPKEIEAFGLQFKPKYIRPYIRRWYLTDLFREYTSEVIDTWLTRGEQGEFTLRDVCATQRKIEQLFCGKEDEKSIVIRNGLYALANEVLFVEDRYEKGKYHPRISADQSYTFRSLDDPTRERFTDLYNDFYFRRHNHFWQEKAYEKLPKLMFATSMLTCAEDLGMIPSCVSEVMNSLQALTLEVERMPKESYQEFGKPENYPYLSVCTTSTHDMSTLREWWTENIDATRRYYNHQLDKQGVPPTRCSPELCELILQKQLHASSIITILPLQDWLSIDENVRRVNEKEERINVPANPQHYWRYRLHLPLEELIEKKSLTSRIKELIHQANREL